MAWLLPAPAAYILPAVVWLLPLTASLVTPSSHTNNKIADVWFLPCSCSLQLYSSSAHTFPTHTPAVVWCLLSCSFQVTAAAFFLPSLIKKPIKVDKTKIIDIDTKLNEISKLVVSTIQEWREVSILFLCMHSHLQET